ncbi:MAG TPA: IS200/IS605 family transposase [Phycisphaerae bacterium]|jgi:putative transposase
MSSHVYHEIYLHFNWHTKNDVPLLTGRLEELAYSALREKCRLTKGVYFHDIGGTDTHVHVVMDIEPFVTISDMVGELKGGSSFRVNEQMRHKALEWQRGYGVVSFGKSHLPWILDYVRHQREHHSRGTTHERLEASDQPDDPAVEQAG